MKASFFLLSFYMLGLAGCGSLGDPTPYTETDAYRLKQENKEREKKDAIKEETKTGSPSKD